MSFASLLREIRQRGPLFRVRSHASSICRKGGAVSRLKRVRDIFSQIKDNIYSGEAALEGAKVKATEARAGITIDEFESRIENFIHMHGNTQTDLRAILEKELRKEFSIHEKPFYFPYDYMSDLKSPEEYVFYLLDKGLIQLRKPAADWLQSIFKNRM